MLTPHPETQGTAQAETVRSRSASQSPKMACNTAHNPLYGHVTLYSPLWKKAEVCYQIWELNVMLHLWINP